MPYKNLERAAAMHAKAARGEIPESVVHEFDEATKHKRGGFAALPEHAQHKADGGEVKGYLIISEEPKHFVARMSNGGEIRIAKAGLSKTRRESFQGLCKGGEVKLAKGGEIPPLDIREVEYERAKKELEAPPAVDEPKKDWSKFVERPSKKLAKGGRVPGFDLGNVTLVKETPEAWHLNDGKSDFRVAKKGISKTLTDRIVQHFAEGGEAEEIPPAVSGDPNIDAMIAARSSEVPSAALASTPAIDPSRYQPSFTELGGMTPAELAQSVASQPALAGPVTEQELAQNIRPENAEALAALPAPPPATAQNAPAADQGTQPIPAVVPAVLTGMPAPTAPGIPGAGLGTQRELSDAYKQAAAAELARADVAKEEAAATLVAQRENEAKRQALMDSWQKTSQAWQARGEELQRQIVDQKIDPNRFMNEKGTAGKISAAIGIILGGIGAGMTRSPNAALQVIENAIGRDIDAQKTELGKKQSLLGYHMQQGHALQASYQLTRADMLDAAAAKLQMTATQFAGDKAQVAAQSSIAALKEKAALTRQQVAANGLQMQLQGLQLEQAKAGIAEAQARRAALQAFSGQPAEQSGRSSMGTRLDPRALELLPENMRERMVTLPDGSYALGRTTKAAEETSKSFEAAGILRDKLSRYGALLAKHPTGVYGLAHEDKATAQALYQSILSDLNGLAGLNRLSETQLELFRERVPDITDIQIGKEHQAKLSELGKEIDDKILRNSQQYLNLPTRRQPFTNG